MGCDVTVGDALCCQGFGWFMHVHAEVLKAWGGLPFGVQCSWQAVAAAASQKFQVTLREEKLVYVFLENIDARKAMENCVAEGYSDQSLESLKEMIIDFVPRSMSFSFSCLLCLVAASAWVILARKYKNLILPGEFPHLLFPSCISQVDASTMWVQHESKPFLGM